MTDDRKPASVGRGPASSPASSIDEPPPLLGTWRNLYVLLLVELAVLVAGFWLIARWASS